MVTQEDEGAFLSSSLLSCGWLRSDNIENLFLASPVKVPALVRDRGNTVTQYSRSLELHARTFPKIFFPGEQDSTSRDHSSRNTIYQLVHVLIRNPIDTCRNQVSASLA